mmetsp:Transcript_17625/g.48755  ORF Transcript_17625/g.48755 Transcript_17625/m.48755 type:complete len:209 (-) Transcript_17625:523-1149(-)
MKPLRIRQSRALILEYLPGFVCEVIGFTTIQSNLFGIFHPLNGLILVGATHKGHGILFRVAPIAQKSDDVVNGLLPAIGQAISKEITGDVESLTTKKGFLELFQGGGRSGGTTSKDSIDGRIRLQDKLLGTSPVALERNTVFAVQKFDPNLLKRYIGNDFHHFFDADMGFGPSGHWSSRDRIDRIRRHLHASGIIDDELEALELREHH